MPVNTHTVSVEVKAPQQHLFNIYHDVSKHPRWSPWLKKVEWHDYDNLISNWKLQKFGLTINWTAMNYDIIPNEQIAWKSLDGPVEHGGKILFRRLTDEITEVSVTVRYSVSKILKKLFYTSWVERQIKNMLQEDLRRFGAYQENIPQSNNVLYATPEDESTYLPQEEDNNTN